MSSPLRSYEEDPPADDQPKAQEQISFRFCRECSNMLYPKEDRMTSKLMFACRTCQFSEEAQSSCVFRNNMYNTVGETAGVTQDVGSDPTTKVKGRDFSVAWMVQMEEEEQDGAAGEDDDEGFESGGDGDGGAQMLARIPHDSVLTD
ncbi:MAG: DNA-directed RNA polymerase II core subunit rpb9 [Ramalina farinacea]|uniref:DNA-directed RNA polymerase II core subunit rpb9 n=1 Tax=Ramalina farinacea TaxID=258253 RepID=A0AA43TWA1_9LECA|nr:DNA-directed RNA polymerase II core subunit rpb9 [Ramalina farinacea]